jgi:oxygen-independent coproporphyrinogen-3 oxidase
LKPTGEIGVYIHFPYCRRRCPYCDFRVDVVPDIPHQVYAEAVLTEFQGRAGPFTDRKLHSIYFGGGTPGLWHPDCIRSVVDAVRAAFPHFQSPVEVTVEANPNDVTDDQLSNLRAAGVGRLSLGVQSFDDDALQRLGRRHDARQAHDAIGVALQAGFSEISFDLMFALPAQTLADWQGQLEQAAEYSGVAHLSIYELTFHEGTPFGRDLAKGRIAPPGEDIATTMMQVTRQRMEEAGRRQYEVSNYAVRGHESVHNQLYWQGAEYLGLGVGAHSMTLDRDGVERRANTPVTADYLAAPCEASPTIDRVLPEQHLGERILLGLRTREGVDLDALERQLGVPVDESRLRALKKAVDVGWLTRDGARYAPTSEGLLFADSLAVEVV